MEHIYSQWLINLLDRYLECDRGKFYLEIRPCSVISREPNDDRLYSVFQLNTHVVNDFVADGSNLEIKIILMQVDI